MNKEIKKIFLVLLFFSLSGGIYYSFQELWLSGNNLSTKTIGIVYSLCALLSVSTIFLCSNLITKEKLKKFNCILLVIKSIVLLILFLLNNSGLNVLIKFLVMVDYVIDVEIFASFYPMITLFTKSDKVYALNSIIYCFAYYVGAFFTSLMLGKTIFKLNFSFNLYCLIGSVLIFIAFLILSKVNLNSSLVIKEKSKNENILKQVVMKIKRDKISKYYLVSSLTGNISYACINGLAITLLVKGLDFTPSGASIFKLLVGILSSLVAILILQKLTLKNDYINLSIKFVGRLILYIFAFLINNKLFYLIAITFMYITSESYSHIFDAPYVNRFSSDEQLSFCNLKEMTKYLAVAIGNLICGFCITFGLRFNFIFACLFVLIQIITAFKALQMRNYESRKEV